MGLFKTIYCAECGKQTKPVFRLKLKDGNFLCSDCSILIPLYANKTFLDTYTLEDYRFFKEHIAYSNRELRSQFHEEFHYYTIHVDNIHDIFYIGKSIDEDTVFFELKNIDSFDLIFEPKEIKSGIVGQKVEGDILFQLVMKDPYFKYEVKLAKDVKVKLKKELFGAKASYENPPGMDDFIAAFTVACMLAEDEYSEDTASETAQSSELQQAMALFMLDSLDNVTMEELKVHRNRLIKAFHPDKGGADDTRYAQKINNAYEALKAAVESHG